MRPCSNQNTPVSDTTFEYPWAIGYRGHAMNPPSPAPHSELSRTTLASLSLGLGLLVSSCEKPSSPADLKHREEKSPPTQGIILSGKDGKPATITFTSPTLELSRSASVLSHDRADQLLALPQVTVAHFEVFGSTALEAIESARRRGHFSENGAGLRLNSRPAGHTSWRVEWSLAQTSPGPVAAPELAISWAAFVVMPEWKGPPLADEGRVSREHETSQWRDFYRHLRTHEAHHVEGVVTQLEQTVASWRRNGTMPRSLEEANEKMRALLS